MSHFKYKVLLVEDLKIAQKVATLRLNEQGCDVDIAESGAQAIEFFGKNQYDLIFMDLGLDDMNGLMVVETIRKMEDESHHVPIIALTAHDAPDIREKCLHVGIDDFFAKPLTSEKIQQILKKYF